MQSLPQQQQQKKDVYIDDKNSLSKEYPQKDLYKGNVSSL